MLDLSLKLIKESPPDISQSCCVLRFQVKPDLHEAICLTDSFVFTPGHCVNFYAMRYE